VKQSPFKKPQLPQSPSKQIKKKSSIVVPPITLKKSDSFINILRRTGSDLKDLVSPRKSTMLSPREMISPRDLTPISVQKSQKSLKNTVSFSIKKDLNEKETENVNRNSIDEQDLTEVIKQIDSPPKEFPESPKQNLIQQSPELDGRLIDEYGFDVPQIFLGSRKKKPFFK